MSTTRDELDLQLARAEAEAATLRQERSRRQEREAAKLQQARDRWDAEAVAKHRALDAELEQEAAGHGRAFDEAAATGDLNGAYAAWLAERATRYTRQHVRSYAQSAASRVGGDTLPDLRVYDVDLLERLQLAAERSAGEAGTQRAAGLLGERP